MKRVASFLVLVSVSLVSGTGVFAAENAQTVAVKTRLKIPEATLEPGQYTFSVEDRLQDRAIVRIASLGDGSHYLVLAVPDPTVKGGHSESLVNYHSSSVSNAQTLKAWFCSGCAVPLAFVYPKAEAAALTDEAGEPVLAVDPSYDKLPSNLSQDDMKVVTLWLLSPKTITPDHKGEGVTGAKLTDARKGTTELAAVRTPKGHLPKTAGDTYEWALAGILVMFAGAFVRWTGVQRQSR